MKKIIITNVVILIILIIGNILYSVERIDYSIFTGYWVSLLILIVLNFMAAIGYEEINNPQKSNIDEEILM